MKSTSHAKPPNIVLLFTDQQRFDTIAAAGFPHMLTPNLDRLVREGRLYRHAYSPNPVCIPARHNLLTGLPARFHGYANNTEHALVASLPTLPRILSDHGYTTRAIGKMHFQPPRRHHGFDRMELMEEGTDVREDDEYAMYLNEVGLGHILHFHGVRNLLYMAPQRSLIPEEHHGSTWVGDRAAAFLRSERGRRPFFLWASWIAPHPPFDVPDTFADLYKGRALPRPLASETACWDELAVSKVSARFPPAREAQYNRRMRELYYAAISLVDKNVGKVLDALEEIGEADRTLVIFTSDHGEMLGDHGAYQKQQPYDSCARIPFIVRDPRRIRPGSVCDDFVDLNDILPTVLDACGLSYPGSPSLPGGSIFDAGRDRGRQYIEHGEGHRRWIALLEPEFKYAFHYGGGRELLFDRRHDPGERINLLDARPEDPDVRAARTRLRGRLCEVEERWGLEGYAANGRFRAFEAEPFDGPLRTNKQFPQWHKNVVDDGERRVIHSFEEELLQVAAPERETMKLHEMALDDWCAVGGSEELARKIREEKR